MESIQNLLNHLPEQTGPEASSPQTNENGWFSSADPFFADKEGIPEPIPCEFCGKPRYKQGFYLGSRIIWSLLPTPCDCPEAIAAREREREEREAQEEAERKAEEERRLRDKIAKIVGESGMGERFLRRTFQNTVITNENRRAVTAAKKYAEGFEQLLPKRGQPEPGRNGLFITGSPGTGKTHIAAAIANYLMAQGRPVICMTMIDLLDRIKRTYSKVNENEGDVLDIYKKVPLLVIDDIGKESMTDWAVSTIYNIVNGRYEAYLPLIVTTNYDTDTLISRMTPRETGDDTTAHATLDRLMEMCKGITLTGESWRSR